MWDAGPHVLLLQRARSVEANKSCREFYWVFLMWSVSVSSSLRHYCHLLPGVSLCALQLFWCSAGQNRLWDLQVRTSLLSVCILQTWLSPNYIWAENSITDRVEFSVSVSFYLASLSKTGASRCDQFSWLQFALPSLWFGECTEMKKGTVTTHMLWDKKAFLSFEPSRITIFFVDFGLNIQVLINIFMFC